MDNLLLPGSVINTTRYKGYEYYLCPSSIKHGGIYFGTGLKSYLTKINLHKKYNINFISDDIKYVINCNGIVTTPIPLDLFLMNRNEYRIYNFCKLDINIIPYKEIMLDAAKYSCKYLGTQFSFRKRGHYCFEIIINSYIASINKHNLELYKFNMIDIMGYKFYNSRSISNYLNFYLVYKKNNNKIKIYNKSNCLFKLLFYNNKFYIIS
ncbi:in vivo virulence related protein [Alphaentomopoxvirus acuprea]|uniref:In vivo virulence related protein n=1 Tax=Alphaentomopoxvirus acuprea TaxID=62099 RepID=W6JIZ7_9POXV|nr:in vivo virulence related protein [Anomala cuprea entomopoxvirus]BAO49588.1 in vivo virulence related protein [Anomala cuprea entomopoxvirus]